MPSNSRAVKLSSAQADRASAGLSGFAAEYANYDGLGLAKLIADKEISPLELLRAVQQRVEALNPKLNALCHLFFDKAEAQIKQCPQEAPFSGVPFVLKDLGQYLTGTITSAGSRVWANNVADLDSSGMDEGTGVGEGGQEGWAGVRLCNCATWLHKARSQPKDQFKREVEKELTGRETEPWEIVYFKL